jgi:hypothetical protein
VVKDPLAARSRVTVTVTLVLVVEIDTPENGVMGVSSSVVWPATVPEMFGEAAKARDGANRQRLRTRGRPNAMACLLRDLKFIE